MGIATADVTTIVTIAGMVASGGTTGEIAAPTSGATAAGANTNGVSASGVSGSVGSINEIADIILILISTSNIVAEYQNVVGWQFDILPARPHKQRRNAMRLRLLGSMVNPALFFAVALSCFGQGNDAHALIRQGDAELAGNHFHEAAESYQRALDLDPSSAQANQQLGLALARGIMAGNVRPSADADVSERAETHLRRAMELAPSSTAAIQALSELDAFLAERSLDTSERAERYGKAIDLQKQLLTVDPGKRNVYLQIAQLERDQFGPALQKPKRSLQRRQVRSPTRLFAAHFSNNMVRSSTMLS